MTAKFRKYYLKQPIIKDTELARVVLRDYYDLITKELLKGRVYKFLGDIKIVRKIVGKKKVVLSSKTSIIRKQTGDSSITIYRTNEDYHSIFWSNAKKYKFFKFKLVRRTELVIPLHRENLMFVETLALSPSVIKYREQTKNEKSIC